MVRRDRQQGSVTSFERLAQGREFAFKGTRRTFTITFVRTPAGGAMAASSGTLDASISPSSLMPSWQSAAA